MPSLAELEQWMEDQLPPNLHDLPMKVTTTIQSYSSHLYSQLSDLTPSYSQIESSIESSLQSIPFVGGCATQMPPPPPPPVSMMEAMLRRADAVTGSRTKTSMATGVGVVGITLAVLTRSTWLPKRLGNRGPRSPSIINGVRQEAIIILGADTPLGQSLAHHLSAQGFIVLGSVTDEQSMQAFESLIPPSSRGYIKSIILDPKGPAAQGIDSFIQSIASAKDLRWPLTSAGDPYSRPGTEIQLTGLINALSYKSISDALTDPSSSMHVDDMKNDINMRVVTPLATIKALLPLLATSIKSPSSCGFVISIIGPSTKVSSPALIAGMKTLKEEESITVSTSTSRKIVLTTLEAQPTSLQPLLLSILPLSVSGVAPSLHIGQQDIRTPLTSPASSRLLDTKGSSIEKSPLRPKTNSRTSSTSDVRLQRHLEFKTILEAVTGIILLPFGTNRLRERYTVRLPTSLTSSRAMKAQDSRTLERTMLLRLIRLSSSPFIILGNAITQIGLYPTYWLSSWTRSTGTYSGSRNAINSRPAYGPGPGPASNTHSRSCIRPTNGASRTLRRPPSSTSTTSSEAARSNESHSLERPASGPPSSTATASGPPSNNGLSSSGLLSSVPSSAFGDGSEEEHFDFEEGNDSPIQGSTSWASPIPSDHDSDTALGDRPSDETFEQTPSASRATIGGEVQYGFPSQASMQSSGEETWMGPASRASPNPSETSTPASSAPPNTNNTIPGTPLGQSWVAVDEFGSRE